jgi:formylmethanofuran dehydrogenase subunit C
MTTLTLKAQPVAPLEADSITPDRFLGKTAAEIATLPAFHGNEPARLGDFFAVVGDGAAEIVVEACTEPCPERSEWGSECGSLAQVKHVGAGMTQGRVTIHGDVGMHLGAGMRGGEIVVHGNAGDWAGAEMAGGLIRIKGNAGHGLGGAYRGSRRGMNRGLIIVEGNAGNEVGATMRRGLIAVLGDVGDFAGAFMIAGSIVVFGRLGARPGAGMKRGTIVTFHPPELLPTFRYDCAYRPGFLQLFLQGLRAHGVTVKDEYLEGRYRRYSGDFTALGKGEILVWEQSDKVTR